MTSRIPVMLLAVCALLLIGAPALAHGWQFTAPEGGGSANFEQAVGGSSNGNSEGEVVPAGGGGVSSPGDPGTTGAPRAPTSSRRTGAAKGGRRSSPNFGAKKGRAAPWLGEIRIPWKTAFVTPRQGYDARLGDLDASLRDGGWGRSGRPSLVMLYDPSRKAHQNAIDALDKDTRVRAASHLFNCFRVDARSVGAKEADVVLRAYDASGGLVVQVKGARATKVFDALRATWKRCGKSDLSKVLPRVDAIVSGIAWCDHHMLWMETKIICPDCGHEREDVVETLGQMKVRKAGLLRALAALD